MSRTAAGMACATFYHILGHSTFILLWLARGILAGFGEVQSLHSHAELDTAIGRYDTVMVNYCMPSGGHCKKMKPAYAEAAHVLSEHSVLLAAADCIEWDFSQNPLCEDIREYPTMVVYRDGDHAVGLTNTTYRGGRAAKDFVEYFTNATYSPGNALAPSSPELTPLSQMATKWSPPAVLEMKTYWPENDIFVAPDGVSAVVKLALPGLTDTYNWSPSSATVLEFSFDPTGKHLMLNGQMLALQVPDPSVPPQLEAAQVHYEWSVATAEHNLTTPDHQPLVEAKQFFNLALDYELYSQNRDDPNIIYSNYSPVIYLNLIGCRTLQPPSYEPMEFLLDSPEQKIVEITFKVLGTKVSNDPHRQYRIKAINLKDRPKDYRVPHPSDQRCSGWSWRCSDVGDPPWYRFIWRRNFDKDGRIGSIRWRLSKLRWTGIFVLLNALNWIATPWLILWIPIAFIAFWIYVVVLVMIKERREMMTEISGQLEEKSGKQDV